jgi:hypothetical protein
MIIMTSTKLLNNHVIFSFDNPFEIHTAAKLYRLLDTKRACGYLTYEPKLVMGSYKGELEPAVMVDYNDYFRYVLGSGFVDNQESILILNPRSPRTSTLQGTLADIKGNAFESLGTWREVDKVEALMSEAYTFMDNKYFKCGDE